MAGFFDRAVVTGAGARPAEQVNAAILGYAATLATFKQTVEASAALPVAVYTWGQLAVAQANMLVFGALQQLQACGIERLPDGRWQETMPAGEAFRRAAAIARRSGNKAVRRSAGQGLVTLTYTGEAPVLLVTDHDRAVARARVEIG